MTRAEFGKWAEKNGYQDNGKGSGRFLKTRTDGTRECYKLNKIKVRHEVEMVYEDGSRRWMRVRSGFWSRIQLDLNGVLHGMSR